MVVRSIKHISCLIFMYGSERKMPSTAISCSLFGCSCGSSLSPPSTITIKLTCIYFTLDSPSLLPHSGAKKEKKRNRRKRELNSFTIRRHAVKEIFTGFLFFLLLPLLDCRAPLSLSLSFFAFSPLFDSSVLVSSSLAAPFFWCFVTADLPTSALSFKRFQPLFVMVIFFFFSL